MIEYRSSFAGGTLCCQAQREGAGAFAQRPQPVRQRLGFVQLLRAEVVLAAVAHHAAQCRVLPVLHGRERQGLDDRQVMRLFLAGEERLLVAHARRQRRLRCAEEVGLRGHGKGQ